MKMWRSARCTLHSQVFSTLPTNGPAVGCDPSSRTPARSLPSSSRSRWNVGDSAVPAAASNRAQAEAADRHTLATLADRHTLATLADRHTLATLADRHTLATLADFGSMALW